MLTVMPASSNAYGLYKTTMGTAARNAVSPEAPAAGAAPKDAIAGLDAEGQKIASDPSDAQDVQAHTAAARQLHALRGITGGFVSPAAAYEKPTNFFTTQYGAAMQDLRMTSREVAATQFGFAASNLLPRDGGITVYSDGMKETLQIIKELVATYNASIDSQCAQDRSKQRVDAHADAVSGTDDRMDSDAAAGHAADSAGRPADDDADGSAMHAAGKAHAADDLFRTFYAIFGKKLTQAEAYTDQGTFAKAPQFGLVGRMFDAAL
ncbi:MAG: hypothetical protein ACFN4G_02870 [Mitsuokella sp.]